MSYLPMYKRMQGDPVRVSDAINDEQRQFIYAENGITYGTPGSATEEDVRCKLNTIFNSGWPQTVRLDALEALHWYTVNNVMYGGVSDVLEEVDSASRSVLYETGGG